MSGRSLLKSRRVSPTIDHGDDNDNKYPIVFTHVMMNHGSGETAKPSNLTSCTAVIGDTAHIDASDDSFRAIEDNLYVMNVSNDHIHSRFYQGMAGFFRSEHSHFAVVFPDMYVLPKMKPITRWRFQHLAFEYPRGQKRGFLVPALSAAPFAYGFISDSEREKIEHLCPPEPIARYIPEEFGYDREELSTYLRNREEKLDHIGELLPMMEDIFHRINGDPRWYKAMVKKLIPEKYRDYDLLYGAEMLGGWDDEATG